MLKVCARSRPLLTILRCTRIACIHREGNKCYILEDGLAASITASGQISDVFYVAKGLASKPFGNVEYVADLTTRGDGSGETIFQNIAFVAFAMDARNSGTSQDGQEGTTSGINLEHMGMWFSQLQDAQKVLNDDTLKGTIFDGGNPPLHAGPQAMTDGQTAPVF